MTQTIKLNEKSRRINKTNEKTRDFLMGINTKHYDDIEFNKWALAIKESMYKAEMQDIVSFVKWRNATRQETKRLKYIAIIILAFCLCAITLIVLVISKLYF